MLVVLVMVRKFKHLRKLIILAAGVIWVGYVFLAKGVPEGVITMFFLLLTLIAMKVEF